jgi:hypothetical protein
MEFTEHFIGSKSFFYPVRRLYIYIYIYVCVCVCVCVCVREREREIKLYFLRFSRHITSELQRPVLFGEVIALYCENH